MPWWRMKGRHYGTGEQDISARDLVFAIRRAAPRGSGEKDSLSAALRGGGLVLLRADLLAIKR